MIIKKVINEEGFKFKKALGQNFIEDDGILEKIVSAAAVGKDDTVLEIGVGAGTLTRAIAEKAGRVFGYEIDKNLAPVLSRTLSGVDNAEVIFKDFMRVPMKEVEKDLGEGYVVIANLPYYITSPIVMRLLEEAKNCKRIVVTVQKEVADRFCADVGTSDYGAITVAINALGNAKTVLFIPREDFYPAPNVDSAVVRIDVDKEKFPSLDYPAFRETVRIAFLSRRKTLANNLINTLKIPRAKAEEILSAAFIPVDIRGERLSAEKFVALSKVLKSEKVLHII